MSVPARTDSGICIDLALELLRTSDLNITEISGRCGFSATRSFNRTVRKIMGISPR